MLVSRRRREIADWLGIAACVVLIASCAAPVFAADYTWKAGTGTWSSTGSWLGGALPTSASTNSISFNGPGANADEVVYLGGNQTFTGTIFLANTGSTTFMSGTAATVSGTNTLTIHNLIVSDGSGPVTFGGPGSVVLNILNSAGVTNGYVNNSSSTLTFYGTLDAAGTTRQIVYGGSGAINQIGALVGGRDFVKFGSGTVSLRAASTLTTSANQAVVAGGVRLVDAGTLPSVTTVGFGIRAGGSLILDNRGTANVADRIANNALIASAFGGGRLVFFGANSAASVETTGTLSPGSGAFSVTSTPGVGGTNTLTFAALSRTSGATLDFAGAGLGSGSNAIVFTSAPTLAANIIGGYATVGNEFATYNQDGAGNANANGVQAVASSAYASAFGAGNNVKLTAAGAFGSVASTVNLQTAAAQAFTVTTSSTLGAVLNYAAVGVNTISGGTMTNGTGELVFITNSDLSVGSRVVGNGTLTKSGSGALTLSGTGATRTSANVFVNAGILKMMDATALFNTAATVTGSIAVGQQSTFEVGTTATWTTASRMPTVRLNDVDATLKVSGGSTFTLDKAIGVATMIFSGNAGVSQAADSMRVFLNAETAADTLDLSQAVQVVSGNSGAATITLSGSGTVILSGTASNSIASGSGNNGYYGWNVTGGGTLLVTSSGTNPLGISGRTVMATRGTVALGSDNTTNYAYALNGGTLSAAGGGTRTINAASTVSVNAASTINLRDAAVGGTANMEIAFAGLISGTGGLTVAATGTGEGLLSLSGSNTFTGTTTLAGGVLMLDSANALGDGGRLRFSGGALRYGANNTVDYSSRITNSGSAVAIDTNGQSVTYGSVIDSTNSGGLVKSGLGSLTLAAANTYTGATVVSAGTLAFGIDNPISASSTITLGSAGSRGTLSLGAFDLTTGGLTFDGLGGELPTGATGEVYLQHASGTATISALTGTSTLHPTLNLNSHAVFTVAPAAALALHANVAGPSSLIKSGSGTMTMHGANSYSGGTMLKQGRITIVGANSLVFGSGTITMSDDTILDLGGAAIDNVITFASGTATTAVILNSGSFVSLSGPGNISSGTAAAIGSSYKLLSTADITFESPLAGSAIVQSGGRGLFTGEVSGLVSVNAGAQAIINADVTGDVISSGSTTILGTIFDSVAVNGGTTSIQGTTAVGSLISTGTGGAAAMVLLSGTVNGGAHVGGLGRAEFSNLVAGAITSDVGGTIVLTNGYAMTAGSINNNGLLVVDRTTPLSIGAGIAGSGNVRVDAGVVALTGVNTYTGTTAVLAGNTLSVNGSLANSALVVAAGAMLKGSGTVAGLTTVAGTHAPGNSPGRPEYADLSYTGGASVVQWELVDNATLGAGTIYDQIVVNGALDFSAPTLVSLVFSGSGSAVNWSDAFWQQSRTWVLYDVAGTTQNVGNLSIDQTPSTWLDGQNVAFSGSPVASGSFSLAQSGQDVLLVYTLPVPEPETVTLCGIGACMAAYSVWKRRRVAAISRRA